MVKPFGSGTIRRLALLPLIASLPALAPLATQAELLKLSAGVDNRYSDNMRQVSENKESDIESRFYVRAEHQSDPGQCNSGLSADLGYGYWLDDTYDPEVYATLDFQGDCELADRLYWDLSNNLRDVTQDSRGTDTPDNTTRKNVFSTGPRYILRLSSQDSLQLLARYENTEFEEPEETDSDRVIGNIAWNHLFSATLSGGISFNASRVELDTGEEIDRDTLSVNFSKAWTATRLSGSIGISEIESTFRGVSQSSDGLVGNLNLEREVNPSTDVYLNASRELTDQTSDFDIQFDDFSFNLRETTTVEATAVRAGIRKTFSGGSSLGSEIFANRSDYLGSGETEESTGLSVNYSRPVTESVNARAGARYTHRTFEEDSSNDDLLGVNLGLSYAASRELSLNGSIGHEARTSDVATRDYDENWIVLGLDYRFR